MIAYKKLSKFICLILITLISVWLKPSPRTALAYHMGEGDMHDGVPIDFVTPEKEGPKDEEEDIPPNNPTEDDEDLDPVYINLGEFKYTHRDVSIPSRGLPVDISRVYRSQREFNGRFGYGWFFNFYVQIKKLSNNNALILDGSNGRKIEFTYNQGNDSYTAPSGIYDTLEKNPDGTHTLTKKHGTKYDFDINGNLSLIVDRNQNQISFTHDPNGKLPITGRSEYFVDLLEGVVAYDYMLTKMTDSLGRDIDFAYDGKGRLTTITDFAGRSWSYTYDANDNLISFTTPGTTDYPAGLTTTYTYDDKHNLMSIIDPNAQTYITNHYDDQDKVDWQTYGSGTSYVSYDSATTTTVTDRKGYVTEWTYNASGNPTSKKAFTQGLRAGDPAYYQTTYEYNSDMEITRETFPAGNCIDYTYDSNGNVLSVRRKPDPVTNDPNITITYTYEPRFNFVKTITDPNGNVTTYTYDYEDVNYGTDVGNLMKITYPEVNTPNGLNSPTKFFTYNVYGQLETVTAPDGIVTKYEYYGDANDVNNYGHLWKTISDYNAIDGFNITTELAYDVIGNVVEINDSNGNLSQFDYDNLGQLNQVVAPSPFNYVTSLWHDENGNIIQKNKETDDSNQPWQITSYTYNMLGQTQTITDPLAYVTTFDYDENENRSLVTDPEDNNSVYVYDERDLLWKTIDSNSNVTEYSYTANGKLEEITDPNGDTTSYQYDSFDRLIRITYPDDTNEALAYDKNSNVISRKNRKDETIYSEHDAMNRLVLKIRPGEPNITYAYDISGRIADVNDGGDMTSYSHDGIGRVTDVNDSEDRLVSYEYDSRGLRTKLVYPDNSYITYEYDALSRLTKIKDEDGNSIAEYEYDALSRRTLLTLGNDANAMYEYDIANRLKKLTNNISDGNSIVFEYNRYDKVGNRLSMKVDDANEHIYQYDSLYQLIFVDYNDGNSTSYSYDSLGNRISVDDGNLVSYSRNNLNQYTSVGSAVYSYDDNGNLIHDGTYLYYYDCENRLTDVNDVNDDPVASYSYDYLGRRVSKFTYHNSQVTKYCYDGSQVIAEYDGNDSLTRKYIYGPRIDEPIAMVTSTNMYYYAFDGLGNVAALSDPNGEIIETYSYDAFGQPNNPSSIGNPYLFTSRRYDSETGLYYYRNRVYAPHLGRFLQTDPTGYFDGVNIYTYVKNNPIMFADPFGLCKDESPIEDIAKDLLETLQDWAEELDLYDLPFDFGGVVDLTELASKQLGDPGSVSWDDLAEAAQETLGSFGDFVDLATEELGRLHSDPEHRTSPDTWHDLGMKGMKALGLGGAAEVWDKATKAIAGWVY